MNKLYWFKATYVLLSNWLDVYLYKIFGRQVKTLRTRSGIIFAVSNLNNNLGTLIEVLYEKVYGSLEKIGVHNEQVSIIDIGANIGSFSLYAAKTLPTSVIYAYEPEENNYRLLQENISLNKLESRVHVHNAAVGAEDGMVSLCVIDESSGKNSTKVNYVQGESREVECVSLDSIFSKHNIEKCDLLKIDCEGAEYEILYKTSEHNFEKISKIFLEWHRVERESVDDLKSFLTDLGYSLSYSTEHPSMIYATRN